MQGVSQVYSGAFRAPFSIFQPCFNGRAKRILCCFVLWFKVILCNSIMLEWGHADSNPAVLKSLYG